MSTAETSGFELVRVSWDDPRAVALRQLMDVEIGARYADAAGPLGRESVLAALTIDPADVVATVLVVAGARVLAHGALRMLRGDWEVKRVVVSAEHRGRGAGRALMLELEQIARQGGATRVILQTGDRQPEAVRLYERLGYRRIEIYEPYVDAIPFSICFEKTALGQV